MEQLLLAAFVFIVSLIALGQMVHPHPHHATHEKLYTAPVKTPSIGIHTQLSPDSTKRQ